MHYDQKLKVHALGCNASNLQDIILGKDVKYQHLVKNNKLY